MVVFTIRVWVGSKLEDIKMNWEEIEQVLRNRILNDLENGKFNVHKELKKLFIEEINNCFPIFPNDSSDIDFLVYTVERLNNIEEDEYIVYIYKFLNSDEVFTYKKYFNGSDDIADEEFFEVFNNNKREYLVKKLKDDLIKNEEPIKRKVVKI